MHFPTPISDLDILSFLKVDYGLMHYSSCLRLSAVLINVAAFAAAALALLELSRRVLKDERLAYKAALYFCLSPASVFFSAAYTESFHAALSFAAMLKVRPFANAINEAFTVQGRDGQDH